MPEELTLETMSPAIDAAVQAALAKFQRPVETAPGYGRPAVGDDPAPATKAAPGPFRSLGEQLMAVARSSGRTATIDQRLLQVKAPTGLGELIPSDGGFLVQQDFATELLRRAYDMGMITSRCRKLPISGNSNGIKINAVAESSRATGSRMGGIQAYWLAEAEAKSASRPKFRQIELNLHKLACLVYATDELLQDAVALESIINQGCAEEIAFTVENAIIRGTGAGQPQGILNCPALVSVTKEVGQAADTIVMANITKMYSRMWGRSRQNAAWFVNQDCEPQLMALSMNVGTGGMPAYMPPGGLSQSPYAQLLGRPVIPCEYADTVGDQGDLIFADFSQYLLADKGSIEAASSIHVQFLQDETVFRFVYRVDGMSSWNVALTPFQSSNTLSPFVVLDARA